jgi:hypothetical protein
VSLDGQTGSLEVRTDSPKGDLLGKVVVSPNFSFTEITGQLKEFTGKKDVYLVFKGTKGSSMQLDWFKFE